MKFAIASSLRGGKADEAIQPCRKWGGWIAALPLAARNDGKYLLLSLVILVSACSSKPMTPEENQRFYKVGKPYQIGNRWYEPREDPYYDEVGEASWYGPGFHGNKTANGEEFDKYDLTAAHRTLPMPCIVRVTNLENGKSARLRVNDRGPFAKDRIIDVSKKAAEVLGFHLQGMAHVRVEFLPEETAALFGGKIPDTTAYAKAYAEPKQYAAGIRKYEKVEIAEEEIVQPLPQPAIIARTQQRNERTVRAVRSQPSATQYVQVGVFRKKENAQRVLSDISRFGVAKMEEIHQEGERFFRVRLGSFSSMREAERVLNLIQQSGYNDAQFIRF